MISLHENTLWNDESIVRCHLQIWEKTSYQLFHNLEGGWRGYEFLWIEKKKRKEAIRGRIAQVTCWWILSYLLGWLTIWSGGLGTFYRERANPRSVWALAPSARLASPRAPSVHPLHPIRLGCRPTDKTYATRFVIIFNYVLDGVKDGRSVGTCLWMSMFQNCWIFQEEIQ